MKFTNLRIHTKMGDPVVWPEEITRSLQQLSHHRPLPIQARTHQSTKRTQAEFEQLLDQAVFIGVIPVGRRSDWLKLGASNLSEACPVLEGMRAQLIEKFTELTNNGGLEKLKRTEPDQFDKIWRAVFLTAPVPKLLEELTPIIDQAIFIGLQPESNRTQLLMLAGKNWESFNAVKSTLQAARDQLSAEFDAVMDNDSLADLKNKDRKHHDMLWRAKFLKEPR